MITSQTVEQLLLVFRLSRERYARGEPLRRSYQRAVREVADRHSVRYQTIGDGCRRRLKLNDISELYTLLRRWLDGDPEPLANQLKAVSDPTAHDDIAGFFGSPTPSAKVTPRQAGAATSDDKDATFSFRLPEHDARKLRALAELEGVSPPELINKFVAAAVVEKMKLVAQGKFVTRVLEQTKPPNHALSRASRKLPASIRVLGQQCPPQRGD